MSIDKTDDMSIFALRNVSQNVSFMPARLIAEARGQTIRRTYFIRIDGGVIAIA